jgi:hypothetical protein
MQSAAKKVFFPLFVNKYIVCGCEKCCSRRFKGEGSFSPDGEAVREPRIASWPLTGRSDDPGSRPTPRPCAWTY